MQIDFFATRTDESWCWELLFSFGGMRVFETDSLPDKALREFHSPAEVTSALDESKCGIAAWPSDAGGKPAIREITFNPEYARRSGTKGRQTLESPSLITFHSQMEQNGCLSNWMASCWGDAAARNRSVYSDADLNAIDWKKHRAVFAKLRREIQRIAPASLLKAPILPDAFSRLQAGSIQLWGWGAAATISSPLLAIKP